MENLTSSPDVRCSVRFECSTVANSVAILSRIIVDPCSNLEANAIQVTVHGEAETEHGSRGQATK